MSPKKAKTRKGPAYKSPEYMRALGQKRWKNVKKADRSEHFSELAKRSHKGNNPKAKRDGYHGGRRPLQIDDAGTVSNGR